MQAGFMATHFPPPQRDDVDGGRDDGKSRRTRTDIADADVPRNACTLNELLEVRAPGLGSMTHVDVYREPYQGMCLVPCVHVLTQPESTSPNMQDLMNACFSRPHDPYMAIDPERHWQPYVELLLRWVRSSCRGGGWNDTPKINRQLTSLFTHAPCHSPNLVY